MMVVVMVVVVMVGGGGDSGMVVVMVSVVVAWHCLLYGRGASTTAMREVSATRLLVGIVRHPCHRHGRHCYHQHYHHHCVCACVSRSRKQTLLLQRRMLGTTEMPYAYIEPVFLVNSKNRA